MNQRGVHNDCSVFVGDVDVFGCARVCAIGVKPPSCAPFEARRDIELTQAMYRQYLLEKTRLFKLA